MKRKIALLLAAVMTMALAVPAFASVTTYPTAEPTRTVITEADSSVTFREPKVPKTIFNTAPSSDHSFEDMVGEDKKYTSIAYGLGITYGMDVETVFAPESKLTYEDAVTWLYRLEDGVGKNGIILPFMSRANGYAQKPLTWAAGLNLVEKTVDPKAEVSSAEVRDMLEKLGYECNIVASENGITRIRGIRIILDSMYKGRNALVFDGFQMGNQGNDQDNSDKIEDIN